MSQLCCVKRSGMTLLELVIVLGILAVLSTVAVRSLEPIADQARYELTQNLMDGLRQAIVGCGASKIPNQSLPIYGYSMDTGDLPADVNALLVRPSSLIQRGLQSFDSDRDSINDINLSSGWNGPYIRLGAGLASVLDGWGNEPTLIETSGVLEIVSLGSDADSISPEDGYRKDLSLTILTTDYSGDILFRLFAVDALNGSRIDPNPAGNEQLGVLFYGVNATGGTTGAIAEQMIVVSNSGNFEVRRSSTLAGTIAARAVLWDDIDGDDVLDAGESILKKSIAVYQTVYPGVDTRVEMELR
jgi:prepilin-type N-terminal cleavage/methylation domain-containing protein